jgi:hypothetical protein
MYGFPPMAREEGVHAVADMAGPSGPTTDEAAIELGELVDRDVGVAGGCVNSVPLRLGRL